MDDARRYRILDKYPANRWNRRLQKWNRKRLTVEFKKGYMAGVAAENSAWQKLYNKVGERIARADATWANTAEARALKAEEDDIDNEP